MWDLVLRFVVSENKQEPSVSKLHIYHSKINDNQQGLTGNTSSFKTIFCDALAITLRMLIEAPMSAVVSPDSESAVELFLSP